MTISFGKTLQGGNIYLSDQTFADLIKNKLKTMDSVFIYEPARDFSYLFSEKPVVPIITVKHPSKTGEETGIIHPSVIDLEIKLALYYDRDLVKDIRSISEEIKKEIFEQTGTTVGEVKVYVTKLIRFREG